MEELLINKTDLKVLISAFTAKGHTVVAPSNKKYELVTGLEEILLDSKKGPTEVSFKEYIFPRCEVLFYFKNDKEGVELKDGPLPNQEIMVLGAKPCDSASLNIIGKIFGWDYQDEFFSNRAKNTLIIGLACQYSDEFCFCTSVGLHPSSTTGSDIFLVPLDDGSYGVQVISEKGASFIKEYGSFFKPDNSGRSQKVLESVKPPEKIGEPSLIREKLCSESFFEHPYWKQIGDICAGCGRCTFICPTCHCFDIVDEEIDYGSGRRMKNWDACQFSMFTAHASGHNPRENQGKRYRQRVAHKFRYYPERFGEILCTGCGRCSRGCPVGVDLKQVLIDFGKLKASEVKV